MTLLSHHKLLLKIKNRKIIFTFFSKKTNVLENCPIRIVVTSYSGSQRTSPFVAFHFGFRFFLCVIILILHHSILSVLVFFFLKNNQKILKPLQRLRIALIHTNPRSSYLSYSLSLSLSLSICVCVCERELLQGVSMATNIGMMDSAYFVGRNEILTWINNRLQLNLSRVEEVLVPTSYSFSHFLRLCWVLGSYGIEVFYFLPHGFLWICIFNIFSIPEFGFLFCIGFVFKKDVLFMLLML